MGPRFARQAARAGQESILGMVSQEDTCRCCDARAFLGRVSGYPLVLVRTCPSATAHPRVHPFHPGNLRYLPSHRRYPTVIYRSFPVCHTCPYTCRYTCPSLPTRGRRRRIKTRPLSVPWTLSGGETTTHTRTSQTLPYRAESEAGAEGRVRPITQPVLLLSFFLSLLSGKAEKASKVEICG